MSTSKKKRNAGTVAGLLGKIAPRNSVRRVAILFVMILAVLVPVSLLSGGWSGWLPITSATAFVSGLCARATGLNVVVQGNQMVLPMRTLSVDPQCTAVDLLAVYIALVLAYPVAWKTRFLAIVAGIPVLAVANILRLLAVAWAAQLLSGQTFTLVHDYLFEFGMVLIVLTMWAVWLSIARRTA